MHLYPARVVRDRVHIRMVADAVMHRGGGVVGSWLRCRRIMPRDMTQGPQRGTGGLDDGIARKRHGNSRGRQAHRILGSM